MSKELENIHGEVLFHLGLDIATSLRILVAQNQNGGLLEPAQLQEIKDQARLDLLSKVASSAGITDHQTQDYLSQPPHRRKEPSS